MNLDLPERIDLLDLDTVRKIEQYELGFNRMN